MPGTMVEPTQWMQQILSESPQGGMFSHSVKLADGRYKTYKLSIATGLARLAAKLNYRNRFHSAVPIWTEGLHPYHQLRLLNGALLRSTPLPEHVSTRD